jgi:hypothetical protein
MRLYGTALYRDRYDKHEGRWKIRYSQFHRLYEIADPPPPFAKVKEYDHEPGVMPPFLDVK